MFYGGRQHATQLVTAFRGCIGMGVVCTGSVWNRDGLSEASLVGRYGSNSAVFTIRRSINILPER